MKIYKSKDVPMLPFWYGGTFSENQVHSYTSTGVFIFEKQYENEDGTWSGIFTAGLPAVKFPLLYDQVEGKHHLPGNSCYNSNEDALDWLVQQYAQRFTDNANICFEQDKLITELQERLLERTT